MCAIFCEIESAISAEVFKTLGHTTEGFYDTASHRSQQTSQHQTVYQKEITLPKRRCPRRSKPKHIIEAVKRGKPSKSPTPKPRPCVKTMLCGGPSVVAVWVEQSKEVIEQFVGLDISVDIHDIIEKCIHLVAISNHERISRINLHATVIVPTAMDGNRHLKVGDQPFELLELDFSWSCHLFTLVRTTEGFYDTALNEASDA